MADADRGAIRVVVATLGENPLLPRTLREIRKQGEPLGAEVLLVVNAAAEAFDAEQHAQWRELADVVLFEERSGKSHALNRAVTESEAEVLAFTDDDALPAPGWLAALVAPLRADPTVAGAGGRILPIYPEGGPPAWYRRIVARERSTFLGPCHDLGPEPRDYEAGSFLVPFGANCAYRRAELLRHPYPLELGPSRATGLRGGEDTVVAMRMLAAGKRLVWVPEATVYHPVEPERMTWEYARRGYYLQGVEAARMRQVLGMPLHRRGWLLRKRLHLALRAAAARLLRARKRHRLRLRAGFLRGIRDEVARLQGP